MGEGKLFKTKLCALYQKGSCHRRNCNFAHGHAELRHFFASANGKREHRGGDLRDKLDKRFSSRSGYSPTRDESGRHPFYGSTSSKSMDKNSERKRRRKLHYGGQSDFSGSLKSSDEAGDQVKRRKNTATDTRIVLKEQLKETRAEISMLDQQKSQLRTLLQEKTEEADILSSRIRELDCQLLKEKEECKRTISKIKKFVKAHKRYVRIQEELKRSQSRLQKLGDQLGSGSITTEGNEEDSSINVVSDGETPNYNAISPRKDVEINSSPREKSLHPKRDNAEELRRAHLTNGGGDHTETVTSGKIFQFNASPAQFNEEVTVVNSANGSDQPIGNEEKLKNGGKNVSNCFSSANKLKGSGIRNMAPSTGMAAHAVDEVVDVEVEEGIEVVETASLENDKDKGASTCGDRSLPFLPPLPPPPPHKAYSQYRGQDEDVDVEGLEEEEEEMVDIDSG